MEQGSKKNRSQSFIESILTSMKRNKRVGARLRRADNPDTEYQSWEYIVPFGVNLENTRERKAFAIVAAALARAQPTQDGNQGLGQALTKIYDQGNESEQGKARLFRLLACKSTEEVCEVLRPMLSLLAAKGAKLSYARLLSELLFFNERTRERWAQDFFHTSGNDAVADMEGGPE